MLVNLRDQVAIVTGSGQGIGAAIATTFAAAGARISVVTRTESHGQRTVEQIAAAGGRALLVPTDVGETDQIQRAVARTVDEYGRLDIVIHNAAYYPVIPIVDLEDEELDRTLAVNLKAAFRLTREAMPHFRAAGRGRILATSSVTGNSVAMPGVAHYAASKAGINGFVRTAALEFARDNVTVNAVEPGFILTEAMKALGDPEELESMARHIPAGKFGRPEDIANAMLFLASDEASYVTGQTIVVDGGSTLPESPVVLEAYYRSQHH